MQTEYTSELRELKVSEIEEVSGGYPVFWAFVGGAAASHLIGKLVDGIIEETGITKPVVSVKNGKVTLWGTTVN
jgi:hypothetical protein